ncbi:MAG: BREX-1 system phosphatase PglZ type B [Chloroflexota bacterium]|nr:BREX-1 system phosphatase PglZ type B [Chloroflexota bacterium]
MVELQYRGVFWGHRNGKDWTPAAFLANTDGGLGIAVLNDGATREALDRALTKLADEPVAALRAAAPLGADYFRGLMQPDPTRTLLLWLNDPAGTRGAMDKGQWAAFREICRSQYDFDPEKDGEIGGAAQLAGRAGAWSGAWKRLAEAPARYEAIPDLLRRAAPRQPALPGFGPAPSHPDAWPQINEEREGELRTALTALHEGNPDGARDTVLRLEEEHHERRGWIWADLGQAPLAGALPSLVRLAAATDTPLGGAMPQEIAKAYTERGWLADAAALDALAAVTRAADVAAVKAAVRALYSVWLRGAAEAFQAAVRAHPFPAPSLPGASALPLVAGQCILFADGLRYDVGQRLAARLTQRGLAVEQGWDFTAVPGVTPTAKPAVSPVAPLLGPGPEFTPTVRAGGAKVNIDVLRRMLEDAGFAILKGEETGAPTATAAAWAEYGRLDAIGHQEEWRLATRVEDEVRALADRIAALLDAGWRSVRIVTDHGWLLLPGSLPKADLPLASTEARKGRCARLKPAADAGGHQTLPWRWDAAVRIAFAPAIACYEAGKEYEHGGLSPQECVVPVLTVTATGGVAATIALGDIRWTGLRCRVAVADAPPDATVDIHTKAADPASSVAVAAKAVAASGPTALVVENEDLAGTAALIVVLDATGKVLTQEATVIGGEAA